MLAGCTTKIASINPNQPMTGGHVNPVIGYACDNFTWPYGPVDDLKQQALQQVQNQANNYAVAAGAKEGELINVTVKKEIWPWFWWLLGSKCVKVEGYARPKTQ
ncbi:hypothetical protein [Helicobacter heilmannii]|uniref:hypothetical protein n=1 Tax=Helicobacter heilmannii TaxID=35817 RepID=UPI0006B3BD6D|nr:hypothetical protein [Helicobacter heilmannii]